ncbi:MAG TPA: hypothetical protein ENK04_04025 [Gammaproteobacteria bacterium]|nr:hypothetical protein [Gammaproteobacteria bacterium]
MKKMSASAPVDDIQLERQARKYVAGLNGQLPSREYLHSISNQHGADLATTVFYHSIFSSPEYNRFIAAIDRQKIAEAPYKTEIKLFIVPAFFYKEYPSFGGGGEHILNVARKLGLDAEVVKTISTGSVRENAGILLDTLMKCTHKEIWVISMSKGSAEVRLMYQQFSDKVPVEKISHWFNVGGLTYGSQFVDDMMRSPFRRAKTRAICLATGAQFRALHELQTHHPFWQEAFIPPENTRITNILGVPLSSHIERTLVTRYNRIKALGPNDGMVLLVDTLVMPGMIYPIWGADHYMRDARVIPVLYRMFSHFLEQKSTSAQ